MKKTTRLRILTLCLSMVMVLQILVGTGIFAYANEENENPNASTASTVDEVLPTAEEEIAPLELMEEMTTSAAEEVSIASPAPEETQEIVVSSSEEETILLGDGEDGEISQDLKNYIQSLEVTGDPSSVAHGDNVTVKFGWLIKSQIHGATAKPFTYQLPVNFKISAAATGNITRGTNGPVIGKYNVDTNGLVTITYNADYNTESQTTVNYMEITGTADYGTDADDHQIMFEWSTGSKVIVVTNPGDFTVSKNAAKRYPSGKLSHTSVIDYTVDISSELGTLGNPITITDTFTATDFLAADTFAFDPNSFVLVDANNNAIPVAPSINGSTFTINNIPALSAGGSYQLTYCVNVQQSANLEQSNATVDNQVSVTSGEITKGDTTTTDYPKILQKSVTEYVNSIKSLRWGVEILNGSMNISGFTFTDTADDAISFDANGKPRFLLQAIGSDGTTLRNIVPDLTLSNGNKTFSFTFPDVADATSWKLDYYTEVDDPVGTTARVNNTGKLIAPSGDEWESSAIGTGSVQGTADPQKSNGGYTEGNEDGTISFHWTNTIPYENVIKTVYEHSDNIQAAAVEVANANGNTSWNQSQFFDDHYGLASELDQLIKKSIVLTIKVDGEEKVLTLDEAADYASVSLFYYTSNYPINGNEVPASDSSTHVKSFKVSVRMTNGTLTNITYQYDTRFDPIHYANGSKWKMVNRLGAETIYSTAEEIYQKDVNTSGSIEKQLSIDETGTWTDHDYTYDYWTRDNDGEITGTRELTFRLLVSPEDAASAMTVTDQLPEGFILVDGSVKVGTYLAAGSRSDYEWTGNSNISSGYDTAENLLTVNLSNVGTELVLNSTNLIVIEYKVTVDDNFEQLDGVITTSDGESFTSSKEFTNTASYGDESDSLTTTIFRSQEVLDKNGAQIMENGSYTNRVRYTVTINEKALDLLEGSDELTLTDVMQSPALDFELDPDSIKLYVVNADGSKTETDPLGLDVKQPEAVGNSMFQTFTITVEDETAYELVYEYIGSRRDDASAPTQGAFNNTISLEGYASDSLSTDVAGINVRVTSNFAGVSLYKVDSLNNTKFLDAVYKLEKYNKETGEYEFVQDLEIASGNEEGTTRGLLIDYYDVDDQLLGNTLYRIIEITAPDDYILDETPYYFVIAGKIEDVRLGNIDATNLPIPTDADALEMAGAAEGAPGETVDVLPPGSNSRIELKNEKAPATGTLTLEGTKELTGRDLQDGEFTFTVTENGTEVATGTNDADGIITFTEIKYTLDDVGEHTYTITENVGDLSDITYDEASFTVTVTVTDNGTSKLQIETVYPDGGVLFENIYTPPTVPEDDDQDEDNPDEDTPAEEPSDKGQTEAQKTSKISKTSPAKTTVSSAKTGDSSSPVTWIIIALAAVIIAGIIFFIRRKK